MHYQLELQQTIFISHDVSWQHEASFLSGLSCDFSPIGWSNISISGLIPAVTSFVPIYEPGRREVLREQSDLPKTAR